MKITIPKGIKIGHAQNDKTGVTVILCEDGFVCGADVRGGAPGTRETDLLKNEKAMNIVNAVVLSGGSAYGLESACGVMKFLREKGKGYKMGDKVVPIVPGAVIYDLNEKGYDYPDIDMGYEACKNATSTPVFGRVGVGTGATVGKIRGIENCDKSGIGAATVVINGVTVTAVVAVNAFGDVINHETGEILAGAHDRKGAFLDTERTILDGKLLRLLLGTNTTIGCIITDAKLNKVQANKLAAIGHNGYARSIRPVHTDYDGDTLFAVATGRKRVLNFAMLSVGAVKAVSLAIENAVKNDKDVVYEYSEDSGVSFAEEEVKQAVNEAIERFCDN